MRRLEGDQAAGIDAQRFALQLALDDGAAGVDEDHAVALQALQDKPLAAEEAGAEPALEGDADLGAGGGTEEGVFLAEDLAAHPAQVHRDDLAGIGRGEGDMALDAALVAEVGHEDRLAGQGALAGAEQLAHDSGLGLGAVAHAGLEHDIGLHVVHRPGFGDHRLAGIELNLDHLHIVTDDGVINFVAFHDLDSVMSDG